MALKDWDVANVEILGHDGMGRKQRERKRVIKDDSDDKDERSSRAHNLLKSRQTLDEILSQEERTKEKTKRAMKK